VTKRAGYLLTLKATEKTQLQTSGVRKEAQESIAIMKKEEREGKAKNKALDIASRQKGVRIVGASWANEMTPCHSAHAVRQ